MSKKKNIISTEGYKPQIIRPANPPKSTPNNGYRPTKSSGSSPAQRPSPPKEE